MKCLVTICSKKKDESDLPLPAHLRYLGTHIEQTYDKARAAKLPMYILSGKYGLVSSEEQIPNYDYYLEADKADELSVTLAEQIKTLGITDIDFYIENKDSWKPYIAALEKSAQEAGAALTKELLFPPVSEIKMK